MRNVLNRPLRDLNRGGRRRDRYRRNSPLQSDREHLVHIIDEVYLHLLTDVLWYIREILLIFAGENRLKNSVAVRCQQLLLDSPDRQHLAAQRDLSRHRNVCPYRNTDERTGYSGCNRYSGGRTILRDCAFGNVDVDVKVPVEILRQPQP